MSFTVVTCDAGHRIHAAHRLSGKTLPCPKCGTPVTVPRASSDRLSDTAVLRILDDSGPDAPIMKSHEGQTSATEASTRSCPKCSVQIGLYLSVCPFCHTYAGPVSDYWKKMLGEGAPANRHTA